MRQGLGTGGTGGWRRRRTVHVYACVAVVCLGSRRRFPCSYSVCLPFPSLLFSYSHAEKQHSTSLAVSISLAVPCVLPPCIVPAVGRA